MKTRDDFVREREATWDELERLLRSARSLGGRDVSRRAALYREVASDLMMARGAGYGADLLQHLDSLAARAHSAVYGHGRRPWQLDWLLVVREFPRKLRENAGFMLASALLFTLPLVTGFVCARFSKGFAESVLPHEHLQQMADMYASGVSQGRDAGSQASMTGFYIWNNVGIAFRCFATGVLFGAGSVFFLVYNGLIIGVITAYVASMGHGEHILTFMCGHAAYELGAIVVAGAAGLRLGYSLVATRGLTRLDSLRVHAVGTVPLVAGAAAMLVLAAFIEGVWSPSSAPYPVKWAFGAVSLCLVLGFWTFAARPRKTSALERTAR